MGYGSFVSWDFVSGFCIFIQKNRRFSRPHLHPLSSSLPTTLRRATLPIPAPATLRLRPLTSLAPPTRTTTTNRSSRLRPLSRPITSSPCRVYSTLRTPGLQYPLAATRQLPPSLLHPRCCRRPEAATRLRLLSRTTNRSSRLRPLLSRSANQRHCRSRRSTRLRPAVTTSLRIRISIRLRPLHSTSRALRPIRRRQYSIRLRPASIRRRLPFRLRPLLTSRLRRPIRLLRHLRPTRLRPLSSSLLRDRRASSILLQPTRVRLRPITTRLLSPPTLRRPIRRGPRLRPRRASMVASSQRLLPCSPSLLRHRRSCRPRHRVPGCSSHHSSRGRHHWLPLRPANQRRRREAELRPRGCRRWASCRRSCSRQQRVVRKLKFRFFKKFERNILYRDL